METIQTLSSLRKILDLVIKGENTFCCLCFNIEENYNIADELSIEINEKELKVNVTDILQSIFGKEIQEYLSTFENVCEDCLKSVIGIYTFIQTCHQNVTFLTRALNKLNESVTYAENIGEDSKSLFVTLQLDNFTSKHFYDSKKNESTKAALKRFKILNAPKPIKSKTKSMDDIKISEMVLDINDPVLKCKVCLKLFPAMWKLRLHFLKVHAPKKYKCPKCPNAFATKKLCSYHITENHSDIVCTTCGKSFQSRASLTRHEMAHHLTLVCSDCGRTYKSKVTYKKHLELNVCKQESRASPADAQLTCDYCGKKYTQKMSLRVHIQYEHGNYKAHVCEWCGKKFWAQSRLKAHIVKHTREKNFICSYCQGKFVTKESLLYHTRLHTGEKPYKCSECGCGFISASRRHYHMKTYHFEGSIECEICHCKFTSPVYLHKHKKVHKESTGTEDKSKQKRNKDPATQNSYKEDRNEHQKQSNELILNSDSITEHNNLDDKLNQQQKTYLENVHLQDKKLNKVPGNKQSYNNVFLQEPISEDIYVLGASDEYVT